MARKRKYRVSGGCVVCMTCIYQCPVGAVSLIHDERAVIDESKCLGCGKCAAACQPEAIEAYEIEI